jgi:hypothetical protein
VLLWPTGSSQQAGQIRFTSASPFVSVPGRYVWDFADSSSAAVVSHTANHRFKQSALALGVSSVFVSAATVENDPSAAANLSTQATVLASNTYRANSQTGITTNIADFFSSPRLSTTGGGTLSATAVHGLRSAATVNSGATVTSRYGVRVENFSGAGSVTNQYGIYVDAMSGATTSNWGIYNAGTTYLAGAVTAASTLAVTGATTLSSTLAVTGAVTTGSTLVVSGAASMLDTFQVVGSSSMGSISATGITGTSFSGPVFSLDDTSNTITGTNGLFSATAFANAPILGLRRTNGTAGSPTNIASGNNIALLGFYGYNSANASHLAGASIRAVAEEAWTTTGYRGTRLELLTALSATNAAAAVRALIDNAGKFYVGATAAGALASIDQTGNIVGATATLTQATVGNAVMTLTSTATNDDPTEIVRQYRGTTTNATPTASPGIGSFTPTAATQTTVQAVVTARRTGGTAGATGDAASYLLYGSFRTTAGGTVTSTGTSYTTIAEHQAGWDAQLKTDGTVIYVEATGATNNNVTWHATVRTWSVST